VADWITRQFEGTGIVPRGVMDLFEVFIVTLVMCGNAGMSTLLSHNSVGSSGMKFQWIIAVATHCLNLVGWCMLTPG